MAFLTVPVSVQVPRVQGFTPLIRVVCWFNRAVIYSVRVPSKSVCWAQTLSDKMSIACSRLTSICLL